MYMFAFVFVLAHMWKSEDNFWGVLAFSLCCESGALLFLVTVLCVPSEWLSSFLVKSPFSASSCHRNNGMTDANHWLIRFIMWIPGIWTQVARLVSQVLLHTEPSAQPSCSHYFKSCSKVHGIKAFCSLMWRIQMKAFLVHARCILDWVVPPAHVLFSSWDSFDHIIIVSELIISR